MIINRKKLLHIQEPQHNNELIWIDLYMISGILRLGFVYNDLIGKSVINKADALYQGLENEMVDGHSYFIIKSIIFDHISFFPYANDRDFLIKFSAKNSK